MAKKTLQIDDVKKLLLARLEDGQSPQQVIKAVELKALYTEIPTLPQEERAAFGKALNHLKEEILAAGEEQSQDEGLTPIDVTAPFDTNVSFDKRPRVGRSTEGSAHPIMSEIQSMLDIFYRMGFNVVESRYIDDDYHMFESLNFPSDHPARDDYDTFMTEEGFIAPAHTSTMQYRALRTFSSQLKHDDIRVVIPGRVFRNEDLDATHEHTFYQLEGVVVGRTIHAGNLVATLQTFLSEYFGENLAAKIQPSYFPFTEPSFELSIERPAVLRKGDGEDQKWLELLGCGMIHPNVLRQADIDPTEYTGFAWGGGIERLVMMKYGIEDIRHFESAKLDFLRQF